MNPFKIVEDFENAVASYTGAPYCVAVNSCTNALFLCLYYVGSDAKKFPRTGFIEIPKRTYIGVAQSAKLVGKLCDLELTFREENWVGIYQLKPYLIFDAAKRFTSNMWHEITDYESKMFMCTSHHWSKILGIQQGGCILHNDLEFDTWARKARFDGRTWGLPASQETAPIEGFHMYMSPEIAAEGLVRISNLRYWNQDQPCDNYPDLSQMEIFK